MASVIVFYYYDRHFNLKSDSDVLRDQFGVKMASVIVYYYYYNRLYNLILDNKILKVKK